MSALEATHGLNCPNCGGTVPIPEGQIIVICPYCELRSFVKGERGLQRYQVEQRINREQAVRSLQNFLSSKWAVARDTSRKAVLEDGFIAHLPFWASWARVFGWVFGQKQVGSGDNKRYEPREVRSVEEMNWNGVACDVGEFGVAEITLGGRTLHAFEPDQLHASGMVFEPVGSLSDAREAAERSFSDRVRKSARLDRISQVFERAIQKRMGLVYYPLWVLRYLYRGRSFQVVVDAFSGEVLYGKAPGSTFYRAAVLVAGMALGSLLAVDGSALAWYTALQSSSDDAEGLFAGGALVLVVGFGLMFAAYRAFRYGEHYEFRRGGKSAAARIGEMADLGRQAKEAIRWLNRLN
jgi:DNA-directed RNA polymerase subunit RPC12/RpoP